MISPSGKSAISRSPVRQLLSWRSAILWVVLTEFGNKHIALACEDKVIA